MAPFNHSLTLMEVLSCFLAQVHSFDNITVCGEMMKVLWDEAVSRFPEVKPFQHQAKCKVTVWSLISILSCQGTKIQQAPSNLLTLGQRKNTVQRGNAPPNIILANTDFPLCTSSYFIGVLLHLCSSHTQIHLSSTPTEESQTGSWHCSKLEPLELNCRALWKLLSSFFVALWWSNLAHDCVMIEWREMCCLAVGGASEL